MPAPVSSIRNLGPASDAGFARAGIHDADSLRAMGADAAYEALLRNGTSPHFIGYYALVMGLQGRPGTIAKGLRKQPSAPGSMRSRRGWQGKVTHLTPPSRPS